MPGDSEVANRSKRPYVKTSPGQHVPRSKRPQVNTSPGQNVPRSKRPPVKMSPGQNVPRSKCPQVKTSPNLQCFNNIARSDNWLVYIHCKSFCGRPQQGWIYWGGCSPPLALARGSAGGGAIFHDKAKKTK